MQTLYITHPVCRLHEMEAWHPESPDRLDAIHDQLLAQGLLDLLDQRESDYASDEAILRVHDAGYLARLQARAPERGYEQLDPDTLMNPHTLQAARAAAGAGIKAVDALMAAGEGTAFCAVRPPGHHARPAQAMGFCLFNNLAIAVAHALQVHGLERVAIVDFDVHHGNGTEEIFAGDERVLMCGFFESPLFPDADVSHAAPNMRNTPVPAGTGGERVRSLVEQEWLPRLEAFRPQLLFISAGFDAHREDELAHMELVESDYAWITARLTELADRVAGGRIVSMLEGGYALSALGRSVAVHIKALAKL